MKLPNKRIFILVVLLLLCGVVIASVQKRELNTEMLIENTECREMVIINACVISIPFLKRYFVKGTISMKNRLFQIDKLVHIATPRENEHIYIFFFREVVVSDLTYVRVNGKWHYICLILDLHNREIIGFSAGTKKDTLLVYQAFATIKHDLSKISIFHTDRGNEFKNNVIDSILETFEINRSLSKKGCPYDNAVAEATFKTIKTEFIYPNMFRSLEHLKLELFDYVNWYNNIRIHSSLGYLHHLFTRFYTLVKLFK